MPFHEAFWAVAGAAAPVLALAQVVVIADLARVIPLLPDEGDPPVLFMLSFVAGAGNILLQGGTLLNALRSLAADHNAASALSAEIASVAGLIVLVLTSLSAVYLQQTLRRKTKPPQTPQPAS